MTRKASLAVVALLASIRTFASDLPGLHFWELQTQIAESFKKQDYRTVLAQLRESDALAPNRPSAILRAARAHAFLNENAEAMAQLTRLLDMRTYFDLAKDPAFEKLRATAEFQTTVKAMDRLNNEKQVHATVAFKIPDTAFFPEGIAYDPKSNNLFVASIRKRKIVRLSPIGGISEFIKPHQDGIWGVSGIGVDPVRRTLWACSTSFEVNEEYSPAETDVAVFAFDLDTGKLKARYPLQPVSEKHFCDGVLVALDGTVFVADSQGLAVSRLYHGAGEWETLLPHSAGISPQGLALSKDGKTLFVSDYMSGLYTVNLDSKEVFRVQSKAKASLAGIDGLVSYGSDLIAIQNGINPNRVVRLKMGRGQKEISEIQVLEMNHPLFGEPTLGVIKGDKLLFVANNPISKFLENHDLSTLPAPIILQRDLR